MHLLHSMSLPAKYEKLFKAIVIDVWQSNYKKLDAENARIWKEIEAFEKEASGFLKCIEPVLTPTRNFLSKRI